LDDVDDVLINPIIKSSKTHEEIGELKKDIDDLTQTLTKF